MPTGNIGKLLGLVGGNPADKEMASIDHPRRPHYSLHAAGKPGIGSAPAKLESTGAIRKRRKGCRISCPSAGDLGPSG